MVKGGIGIRVRGHVVLVGVRVRVNEVTRGGGESGVWIIIFGVDVDPQSTEAFTNGGLDLLTEREKGERVRGGG